MSGHKFGNKIKKFLTSFDIFGVEPKLNMKHTAKHNSTIGGIISIFFLISTFLGIFYFGQELVYKKEPSVIQSKVLDADPDRFNLSLDKFNFFIGISDGTSFFIDNTFYEFTAEVAYYLNNTYTSIPLRVEKCQMDKHFIQFGDLFIKENLGSYQCINPLDTENLFLQGYKGSYEYAVVRLNIKPCKSGSCQKQDVVSAKFRLAQAYINFVDITFNPKDFNNPQGFVKRDLITRFNVMSKKLLSIYFHNIEYITDSGLVFESLDKQTYLEYENSNELVYDRSDTEPFLIAEFKFSNIKYATYRKYYKLQKFLSEIGGLIKGIMGMLQITIMVFSKTNYFAFLINEIYIYTDKEIKQQPPLEELKNFDQSMNKTIIGHKSALENNFMGKTFTSSYQIAINSESLKKFNLKKQKIKLTWCDFLKTSICKCYGFKSSSIKYFKIGKDKIRSNMNIIRLNRLCDEFEMIKDVLFDYNSRILINFITESKRMQFLSKQKTETEVSDVVSAYNSLDDSSFNNNLKLLFDLNIEKGL
jgi:hypothetical protein